ncbi:MAG TPA: response regulator transcription factor [Blastocatellia bacterium]|nr:response regulator transcription factor [Blastocatellia bacterium]
MKGKRISVLVVDDHLVVRLGLKTMIDSQPDMQVVAECGDGSQALELFREKKPDVTIMELRIPGMNGAEVTQSIRAEYPKARILMLSSYSGDEDIHRALQAGARGYLLKDTAPDEILNAIRAVYAGQHYVPARVMERVAGRIQSSLTNRELEILSLIVKGLSNREIGGVLRISEGTVKNHILNILSKMGVHDRTQAAIAAVQRGIVYLT